MELVQGESLREDLRTVGEGDIEQVCRPESKLCVSGLEILWIVEGESVCHWIHPVDDDKVSFVGKTWPKWNRKGSEAGEEHI